MTRIVKRLFFVYWALTAFASAAQGATIVYASKKYVIIDAGTENSLEKGHKVCFFDTMMSLLGCGPIKAIRPRLAGIVIPKEQASRLTVGMIAKSEFLKETGGEPKATKKEIAKFVKALKKAEKSVRKKEELTDVASEPETETDAESSHGSFSLNYLFSGAMPFSFKVPAYELLNEINRSGSLWTYDRLVAKSPLGVELAWNPTLSPDWRGDVRLYYRYIPNDGLIVNYDVRDPRIGLRGMTTASSAGLFLGFSRWWGEPGIFTWRGGGGLDIDVSSVQYSAETVDGTEAESVASVSSRLTALSLRLDGGLRVQIGPLGVDLGLGGLLPVVGQANTSAKVPGIRTSVTPEQLDSAADDLKKALAHQRTQFGYQVTLGISALY